MARTQCLQAAADREERPSQPTGLGIGEGDEAGLAERIIGAIAGEDMPEVMGVARAPPEPRIGMLRRTAGVLRLADRSERLGRIASLAQEGGIGRADAALREAVDEIRIGETLGQLDPLISNPPALGTAQQPLIAGLGRARVQRAHDPEDLGRVVRVRQQLSQPDKG